MEKRIAFLFACMVACSPAMAQHLPANQSGAGTGLTITDHMLIKDSKRGLEGESAAKIEGSPYLNESFAPADVYSSKGKFPAVLMRYNIYTDEIEYKQKDIIYILLPGTDVKKVVFGDHVFVVETVEVRGKPKSGYFSLLDSGKVTLLAKKVVTFREAQAPKALEVEGKPAKYSKSQDEFLYKIGDGPLMELNNVKKMIETFPDKHDELRQFVATEKISRNEKELTKLIKYYNSL